MQLNNFSRIDKAIDVQLVGRTHIVAIGAGGAYCLYESLARTGLGELTVFDFDKVEEVNITRQGYQSGQIGMYKVEALGRHLSQVNTGLKYLGVKDNFLTMNDKWLDYFFGSADLFLLLTDSFEAQAFGNKLALRYKKPAVWAGFYEKSRCAEIVFTIPGVTPACFRCAVSSRYKAQAESIEEITVPFGFNTIFHSQLLDSLVGMVVMAVLHNDTQGYEFSNWFGNYWDRNLIQFKVSPEHGNKKGSLFQRVFDATNGNCFTFNSIWQHIEGERPPKYDYCPDCFGHLINEDYYKYENGI